MKDAAPQPIRLSDYAPFPWRVDSVELGFVLAPEGTRVTSRIAFRRDPDAPAGPFFLHGEHLRLVSARIDGAEVSPALTAEGLTCEVPEGDFLWEADVEIDPATNTALEGLYMSNGIYCTQCEAEGFRRITYYPDRPDVMAPFTVRIETDAPVALSNGNPAGRDGGAVVWHDPWPKPAYLFALVAGNLAAVRGSFTTRSGAAVDLAIWVRPGDEDRCDWAMECLKASMRWDEDRYGREYDLEVFNIVAVDDFNAGAMENKGLNVFNSALVLASPETATDGAFERIEAVIAHEYFHNWTGNRVTCRDWFQLCLKEGLTVFRDQQFTADLRSAPVKRIEDAGLIRTAQFSEDSGPLAHPVRPEEFLEINNFYTITVYEKGAEVVGMLKRLVGDNAWRAGCDLYFERHDGEAVTIEDWLKVFEDVTGRDLAQFKRWYSQAGTPRVTVTEEWDGKTLSLTFRQATPPTPGQTDKAPVVIPMAVGLLHPDGTEILPTQMLELDRAEQVVTWDAGALCAAAGRETARPVPSLLRGFSAPVVIEQAQSDARRAFLLASDTDPFNRWEAGHALMAGVLSALSLGQAPDETLVLDSLAELLDDDSLDPAFRAMAIRPPGNEEIARDLHEAGHIPDPLAIHSARRGFAARFAARVPDLLARLLEENRTPGPYSPDAASAARRSLAGACLALLTRHEGPAQARAAFAGAGNMTESLGALSALLEIGEGADELSAFEQRWQGDRLVMDRWFALQVAHAAPEAAAGLAGRLTRHPAFTWSTPNRVRAVVGALAGNLAGFHHPSLEAYGLYAGWLRRIDGTNPQLAARLSTAFKTWRRYDAPRQTEIERQLAALRDEGEVSRDLREMVDRMLA